MAEVLVLVELNPAGGGVRKTTLEALTAARALGEPSAVVIAAPGSAAGVKDSLAEYGAATVYVAESPEVDEYLVADNEDRDRPLSREPDDPLSHVRVGVNGLIV